MLEVYAFLRDHYKDILAASSALLLAAEIIVRLTPTDKDDGFVKRIGSFIDAALDKTGVPNIRKNNSPKE